MLSTINAKKLVQEHWTAVGVVLGVPNILLAFVEPPNAPPAAVMFAVGGVLTIWGLWEWAGTADEAEGEP